ncbi:hypothetical protein IO967_004813, partial [Escherichia coli]|nr:hypothetical protein [Escherichia coli]
DISSSGFDLNSVQGASIAVEVDAYSTDTSGSWLFKNTEQPHSTQLKTRPKIGSDWTLNPQNKVTYTLKRSQGNSVNIRLPIETNSGNTNVPAGSYNLPLTVSYNSW